MTYLMIRLVAFPQNRFVAIEAVNLEDKEWIFGCNAKYTYFSYRYCKNAISLSELSRWTGAAADFGKRKLATINLHKIKEAYPDWTHVIVKVSPTRKPIVLNVDINDHASREIKVDLPSEFSFGKFVVVKETEPESLYYELVLKNFNLLHQAYLLHVEPTASCKATQYHVSAELHVPWAPNHETYHYFTISTSWYLRLAQLARNYSPVLVPYAAAVLLLAVRSNIQHLQKHGSCMSLHSALMSESVKPYYALVFCRLGAAFFLSIPFMSFLFESASWENPELRIMWRGGSGLAEKVASGLQKVPMVVSAGLLCAAPLSCGAASLVAGAAFYAFMVGSRVCYMFKKKNRNTNEAETSLIKAEATTQEGQGDGNNETGVTSENTCPSSKGSKNEKHLDVDEDLSNLNFHMMMFSMWLAVTLVNVPVLLTWARNFSYSMVLKPDTSYNTGLIMSACSTCVWQMNGPRKNLRHYESVTALLFSMAVFLLALGPVTLTLVNYGITFMFAVITVQQICDKEDIVPSKSDEKNENVDKPNIENEKEKTYNQNESNEKTQEDKCDENISDKAGETSELEDVTEDCEVCSESRIFNIFKRLGDKMSHTENL
ncbi:hypothetical protein HF086_004042 [Spodoptera exigua]|uniref:GPI inositol-deacylase n=1 Tax=Spodoptera exigua TaxID=7107 RepID=A0A922MB95_SPOEX|nr:hypothetical protein HF086_004042 [Spodoptera exigua]